MHTHPLRRPPHPANSSFNFKPQEGPETPVLCYYRFGACEILADAPADCKFHFLFAFLLNQAPSVSLQDHIQGVIPSPFRKPQIHFTPEPCSSSMRALLLLHASPEGPLPCLGVRRRGDRRGKAPTPTTGPRRTVCLIPLGLCYLADASLHTF